MDGDDPTTKREEKGGGDVRPGYDKGDETTVAPQPRRELPPLGTVKGRGGGPLFPQNDDDED